MEFRCGWIAGREVFLIEVGLYERAAVGRFMNASTSPPPRCRRRVSAAQVEVGSS